MNDAKILAEWVKLKWEFGAPGIPDEVLAAAKRVLAAESPPVAPNPWSKPINADDLLDWLKCSWNDESEPVAKAVLERLLETAGYRLGTYGECPVFRPEPPELEVVDHGDGFASCRVVKAGSGLSDAAVSFYPDAESTPNSKVEPLAIQRNLALRALGLPLNATPEQINARWSQLRLIGAAVSETLEAGKAFLLAVPQDERYATETAALSDALAKLFASL
jgi:hypothetical protein